MVPDPNRLMAATPVLSSGLPRSKDDDECGVPVKRSWPRLTRDGTLFLLGIAIIVNEAFVQDQPDPTLILLGGSLAGSPFLIGKDEKEKS